MYIPSKSRKLPFEENRFDSVVATLVFCTIPNQNGHFKK
ncbi:methyltransferase domain-containing protein [Planococcus versutus]